MRAAINDLATATSEVFGISRKDILGHARFKEIVHARKALYLAAEMEGHEYAKIGRVLKRDHSTIISGCRSARWHLENDPDYAAGIAKIRALGKVRFRPSSKILAMLEGVPPKIAANDVFDDIDRRDLKDAADAARSNARFLAALAEARA